MIIKDEIFRFELSGRSRRNSKVYILADAHSGKWIVTIYQVTPLGAKKLAKTLKLNNEPVDEVFQLVTKELKRMVEVLNAKRNNVKLLQAQQDAKS